MLEPARRREMIGPLLRAAREIVVPTKTGNAHQGALAIVAVEKARVEIAEARLRAGGKHHDRPEEGELACLFGDASHAIFPKFGKMANPAAAKVRF